MQAKYSSAGTPIRVVASGTQDEIIVRVIDQGVGIPADMFEHVFDLYRQVDRLEDRTHDGLGIGLSLVKRIIELHGGTATAASAGQGRGSAAVGNASEGIRQRIARALIGNGIDLRERAFKCHFCAAAGELLGTGVNERHEARCIRYDDPVADAGRAHR
jgi:signal transduction histidine kinase